MKLFAIFGNPVAHSISPLMHNGAFTTLGIDACYTRWLLEEGERLKATFFKLGLEGANVTVPHKEAAFRAADKVEGIARQIGAVNTLVRRDGRLIGHNTDAPGFYRALSSRGTFDSALVIGAGGTAKALATVLRSEGVDVTVLNRSEGRLAWFEANGFTTATWETFAPQEWPLIVNTTSAGLKDAALPAPGELLAPLLARAQLAFDVIYGRSTPYLELAKAHGVPTQDGLDMLLWQGVLAFEIFTDHRFGQNAIEAAMRLAVTQSRQ